MEKRGAKGPFDHLPAHIKQTIELNWPILRVGQPLKRADAPERLLLEKYNAARERSALIDDLVLKPIPEISVDDLLALKLKDDADIAAKVPMRKGGAKGGGKTARETGEKNRAAIEAMWPVLATDGVPQHERCKRIAQATGLNVAVVRRHIRLAGLRKKAHRN